METMGGGANGAAKLGGGEAKLGLKVSIFQTELGPRPVTRCDHCYAFFPTRYSTFKQQAQHIFKSEKY